MRSSRAAAAAVVSSFIDCVNRGDIDSMANLMTDDLRLVTVDGSQVIGRAAVVEAWTSYLDAFPDYLIFRRHVAVDGARVAVLGTTTGSHLGLPAEEEMRRTVLWLAEVSNQRLSRLEIVEDSPQRRLEVGISTTA